MKIALLGAGLQGIATALDLAKNTAMETITIVDYNRARAEYVASLCNEKYGAGRVETVQCNVSDYDSLVNLINGYDLVINEVNYYYNTFVMDACLEAGVNYMDIGGLYVETKRQMKYHDRYKDAGLIAVIGIGGTPGFTNVCARWAADRLDTVEKIEISCGCDDWSGSKKALDVTYSIETIMDEFYMSPIQYIDGEYREVPPRSGGKIIPYAQPIGEMYSYYIMHSEIATLPKAYQSKGIKDCTFRIGFPDSVKDRLEFLHGLGFSRSDKVAMDGNNIIPVRVLKRMMDLQPDDPDVIINDCDIIKTVVTGTENNIRVSYELEVICRPVKEWPELLGAQVYIGGAPAWAAELLRRGLIEGEGAFAPVECIPPEHFFEEAAKREMYVNVKKQWLVGSADDEAAARKKEIDQSL